MASRRYHCDAPRGTAPSRPVSRFRVCHACVGEVKVILGRQHALCGLIVGVATAGLIDGPIPPRLVLMVTVSGASLLNDLDHRNATASKSLGPVTKVLGRGIAGLSALVYHATRGPHDPPNAAGEHRHFTHTVPATVLAGVLATVLSLTSVWGAAVLVGLMVGLLSLGFRRRGALLAALGTAGAGWTLATYPGWWWVVPVGVTLGCLAHLPGDLVTPDGVPVLWPLMIKGRRWKMIHTPATFKAGGPEETTLVFWGLSLALVLDVGLSTGLLPILTRAAGWT